MDTIHLEEMTWTMVEEAIAEGYKTVVMAVGSIEQHGHHLPLATDTYLGDVLATRTAEKLGKTLVAPTIRPGCSEHHLTFPGTISISP
ncbi:MAG: creatininase family protein, partial [Candidatus Bathyarchaeota archaeon]|nr:creatininase family protein [Candidatus Bathyarchaeota archaeon]